MGVISRLILILVICQLTYQPLYSQRRIGFELPAGVNKLEIPFEEYSNLIVIPITINGFITVRFVLDTGAESAILTEKALGDLLNLQYVREITIVAPGINDALGAFVATNVQLSLPFGVNGFGMNMLVLKEDYLELSQNLGAEIYGIIGYDIFSRFVVEIDYLNDMLILYAPDYFQPRSSFTAIPMPLKKTKPFIEFKIGQHNSSDTVSLLIDTGASHAMLLDVKETKEIELPKKLLKTRLGQGIGGEIPGFIGRMETCAIDKFDFRKVLVSIPLSGAYTKAIKRGSLHGTIGGDLLSRFRVIIDYQNETLYLKKGSYYKVPFEFDMSGLTLGAKGTKLDSLVVLFVRDNTPAKRAGVKAGDYVKNLNGYNLHNSTLSQMNAFLRKRPGVKVRMTILRGGQKIKKRFKLDRMI